MKKQEQPPSETGLREPLTVFVEKIKDKGALVHGDISKTTLRELLMSSLMLVPRDLVDDKFASTVDFSKLDLTSEDIEEGIRQISKIYKRTGKDKSQVEKFTSVIRKTVAESLQRKGERKRPVYRRPKVPSGKMEFIKDYGEQYPDWMCRDRIPKDAQEKHGETESFQTLSSLTDDLDLSHDAKWLRKYLKTPLKVAMKEIVAKKPYDPVGYLGFWLLNYRQCQEHDHWQLEKDQELGHLRSLIKDSVPKDDGQEYVSVNNGDGEETRDWNFKYYDTEDIGA